MVFILGHLKWYFEICCIFDTFVQACSLNLFKYYKILSYDVAPESEITLCIKIDQPLVVYRFSGKDTIENFFLVSIVLFIRVYNL